MNRILIPALIAVSLIAAPVFAADTTTPAAKSDSKPAASDTAKPAKKMKKMKKAKAAKPAAKTDAAAPAAK